MVAMDTLTKQSIGPIEIVEGSTAAPNLETHTLWYDRCDFWSCCLDHSCVKLLLLPVINRLGSPHRFSRIFLTPITRLGERVQQSTRSGTSRGRSIAYTAEEQHLVQIKDTFSHTCSKSPNPKCGNTTSKWSRITSDRHRSTVHTVDHPRQRQQASF